ncbi:hypothetical protein [Natrinema pallidum]|uniref:Uncharacterized protein n=1 Tax=Natrinema pallidum DSM 3751 TaxID=1227495 RepID=L9ZDR2_9EURY|nr:hypothetical protein [Natrinema pallidum]ELY83737.1 hypothetical protein C487_00205 [Natrinema pallidum DSM 3751]
MLYFITVSGTTDGVTIDVYEPTASDRLGEVESRSGKLFFEDRDQYDDRFDERAATVRELED